MATLMLVARSIAARLSGLGVLATSAKLGEAATTSTPCCEELLLGNDVSLTGGNETRVRVFGFEIGSGNKNVGRGGRGTTFGSMDRDCICVDGGNNDCV